MSQQFDESDYRNGYSIAVSGVVLSGDKVLLVHAITGDNAGEWEMPGGFVETDETIDTAVKREIQEEAGVDATLTGLIAVRNVIQKSHNEVCCIFLLHADSEQTAADGTEVDQAQYFTREEMEKLPNLNELSRLVITRVFEGDIHIQEFCAHPKMPPSEYVIYL